MANTSATTSVDAVAGALGVTLTDADRTAYQAERPAEPPVQDPPVQDPPVQDPPVQDPPVQDPPAPGAPAPTAPAATGTEGEPEITPEALEALLNPKAPAQDTRTGVAELDEEIPADLNERTRARMEKLVERGRQSHNQLQTLTTELEQARPLAEQGQAWQQIVVQSGLAPQEFGAVMGTMAAINAGTIDQKRVALAKIRELYERVATDVGEPLPGADPSTALAAFPDLQQQVANLEITASAALEIAAARRDRAARQASSQQADQATQQQRELTQAQGAAEQQLNLMGSQLAARDGVAAFQVRRHIAFQALKSQAANLHPSRWPQAFLDAYEATPKTVVDAAIAQLRGGTGQQQPSPQRRTPVMQGGSGSGGAGGGGQPVRKPTTALEAVAAAMGVPTPVE